MSSRQPRNFQACLVARRNFSKDDGGVTSSNPLDEKNMPLWAPIRTKRGRNFYWNRASNHVQWHAPGHDPSDYPQPDYQNQNWMQSPKVLSTMKWTLRIMGGGLIFIFSGGLSICARLLNHDERIRELK